MTDRNASEARHRIVVVGMWLIFGPQLPILFFGLFLTVPKLLSLGRSYSTVDRFATELIRFCVLFGYLTLSVVILRNVTARYLRARRAAISDEVRADQSAAAGDEESLYGRGGRVDE